MLKRKYKLPYVTVAIEDPVGIVIPKEKSLIHLASSVLRMWALEGVYSRCRSLPTRSQFLGQIIYLLSLSLHG